MCKKIERQASHTPRTSVTGYEDFGYSCSDAFFQCTEW